MASDDAVDGCHLSLESNWNVSHLADWNDTLVPDTQHSYRQSRRLAYGVIMPIILAFGVVGNVINIVIFSQKRLRMRQDTMEKSATIGLVTLAAADLLFCLVGLPSAFVDSRRTSGEGGSSVLALYYTTYRQSALNVCVFTSTWFIITLSLERYLAIGHPFRARSWIRVWRTLGIKLLIAVFAVLLNVPDLLRYDVRHGPCPSRGSDCQCYYARPNVFFHHGTFAVAYRLVWHALGTFTPLVLLVLCNVKLAREIYRSAASDRAVTDARGGGGGGGGGVRARDPTQITVILVAIVSMFVVLVCPSMLLSFLGECAGISLQHYQIAVVVTNLAQALNFAVNFVLYCAVSPKFRRQFGQCRRTSSTFRTAVTDGAAVGGGDIAAVSGQGALTTCNYELVDVQTT